MNTVRVLLAHDLMLVRQGIRALLSAVEDLEIVGDVATANDAVLLVGKLHPHVALIDQGMAESMRAIRLIKETLSTVEVVVITDHLDEMKAFQAIEAGATGYVLKDIPVVNLVGALRAVCNGRGFLHPEITRKLMGRLGQLARNQRDLLRLEFDGLTKRELDIITELSRGSTDREIAAKLVVTEGTVKTHLRHILHKLGARNRTQAVAHVLRKRLID